MPRINPVKDLVCACGTEFQAKRTDATCPACREASRKSRQHNYEREHSSVCADCGAPIVRRTKASRCRSCAKRAENLTGERNPNWKGGRSHNRGYVMVKHNKPDKIHPYQGEHILVWEQTHGLLPKGWNVHHFNGVKDDNRPDNLIGMSASDHHVFGPEVRRQYEDRIRELEEQLAKLV